LGVDHELHGPNGCRAGAYGMVGDRHAVSRTHRPEAVGDGSVGGEQSKAIHLDHVIDDRVAVVQDLVSDPTRPGLDRERCQVHGHVGVQQDGQAHRERGALVAERVTRVSEKRRPTPLKVLRLKDLPPLGYPICTEVLPVDAVLHADQLTAPDEPGEDSS